MKFLSYGVMVYMLLALVWWTILLSRNNTKLYQKNLALAELSASTNLQSEMDKTYKDFLRNKYMILGEGMVFGISLIIGLWFIQKAYTREVKYTSNQKNFLLSITHELKSPIAAINLIAETLIKRKLPEVKVLDLQQSILAESSRLEKLINNLLLATKIDSGYQYNFENCNLNEMLTNSIKRIQLQNASAQINAKFPSNQIIIIADRESIYSVINNLLENSLKYTKENPIIDISLTLNSEYANFTVADQGLGIPDVEKSKVLEQFYRVGNEETRQTKGTGLGLYIVNKIVAAHNGKLNIQDHKPSGTAITISLPIKQNK
jgi:signal transduction histidine kinase